MEREEEVSINEVFRKRDRPDPQIETTTVDEHLASDEKFWAELTKGLGARPIRNDSEHMEAKTSWMKMDLAAEFRKAEEEAAACLSEDEDDEPGFALRRFRCRWNNLWFGADRFGDFEDTTLIRPMRYTDDPPRDALSLCDTLQIFSAKVAGLGDGLQWPLAVFGLVAIRDTIDQNRNIIFQRSSLNCQTLTDKDSNLVLTGPTRSVVLMGTVFIEVDLKVKGTSEDKTLFSRVLPYTSSGLHYSRLLQLTKASKFSTLEFTLGHIISSLEATISVQIIDGSWPDGFRGQFVAYTTSIDGKGPVLAGAKSVNHKEIVLFAFGPEEGHLTGDRTKVELSRSVVCVEDRSKLEVSVKACQDDDNNTVVDTVDFTAKESGKSYGKLKIASCKMEVTVAWSLISSFPELRKETILNNNCRSS